MKLRVVIVALIFARWQQVEGQTVRSSQETKRLTPEGEACVTELNLNREKIVNVDWFVDILPEDDDEFTQFMGCLTESLGLMKPDGEMDFDKIKEAFLTPARSDTTSKPLLFTLYNQIVTDSVANCQKNPPTGLTPGHTALKTLNCVSVNIQDTVKHQ